MLKKQFSAQIKYVCVVCAGLAHRCLGCSRASVRCGSTTMVHSVSTRTVICWTGRCFELQTFAWTGRCFCVVDIRLDWQVFVVHVYTNSCPHVFISRWSGWSWWRFLSRCRWSDVRCSSRCVQLIPTASPCSGTHMLPHNYGAFAAVFACSSS